MKKFIELKKTSVYPFVTPNGWIYLVMPVSIVECFIFFHDPEDAEGGTFIESTFCLN